MNRYVDERGSARERASATPTAAPQRRSPEASRAAGTARAEPGPSREGAGAVVLRPGEASLSSLQRWFVRAVTTPESEAAAVTDEEAARFLTAGPRMTAIERLEIYRRAYHSRLVECLADDYPALAHALGEAAFDALCRAYIAAHPSASFSLNFFGRHMADFCREGAALPSSQRAFAADLATLEWAIVHVIHAPSSEPLTVDGLRAVPPEAWAEARLEPNSAFRLLSFGHPVNAYLQGFRAGAAPSIPSPEPSATAVYRSGRTVWRMDLTLPMFDVLSALASGETLGDALARADERFGDADQDDVVARVMGWFREWVGSGLFARVVLG